MNKKQELEMQEQVLVIRELVRELRDKKARTSWEELEIWEQIVLNDWTYSSSALDLLDDKDLEDLYFTGHCRLMNLLRKEIKRLYEFIQKERR